MRRLLKHLARRDEVLLGVPGNATLFVKLGKVDPEEVVRPDGATGGDSLGREGIRFCDLQR
jgi:hypothetical protein